MKNWMERRGKPVPFPNFFAVLGYCVFWLIAVVLLVEYGSYAALFVVLSINQPARRPEFRPCRGTRNAHCTTEIEYWDRWLNVMSASPAYAREAWAEQYWREQRALWKVESKPYEPFTVWGNFAWHSQYINNDLTKMGTLRRTMNATSPRCPARDTVKIWFFGGSTAWGMGTPDSATIPSYLSQKINGPEGKCAEVVNLGVNGFVSNQEVILLMQELKKGRNPDIVIFYDGVNDAFVGAISPGIASTHDNYEKIKQILERKGGSLLRYIETSYSYKIANGLIRRFRATSVGPKDPGLEAKGKATLENYEANIRLVRHLAMAYGFKAYFFWQPSVLYGHKPLVPFEQALRENPDLIAAYPNNRPAGPTLRAQRAVSEEAEKRAAESGEFVFLGAVFDHVKEPLYIDWMHLGPRGNEIVAEAIAEKIQSEPKAR